jgi:hypothetical protein
MLQTGSKESTMRWQTVADIPRFPFEDYEQLKAAVAIRSFNIGVNSLAAAEWSEKSNSRIKRSIVTALSLLIMLAAIASVVAAFLTGEYWLLAAAPIQAVAFYLSHPASPIHKWATIGGAISVAVFLNLLFNGFVIAAALVAYVGLTFAAVRAAGYITNSSYRTSLLEDETMFVNAYADGACTLRNNRTKVVYSV